MTQDCGCEASYDSTAQLNPIPQGVIFWYGAFSFFGDGAEYKLVAEFIDSELTDCIRYLSEMVFWGDLGRLVVEGWMWTYLHRMGRKPAYSSRKPPSLAIRMKPDTRPVANPRSETSRIRVASRGVNKTSAKNLYNKKKESHYSLLATWVFGALSTQENENIFYALCHSSRT